ncbi:hypothetical protein BgiMline_029130, partial [Biomphalaria glabrata]
MRYLLSTFGLVSLTNGQWLFYYVRPSSFPLHLIPFFLSLFVLTYSLESSEPTSGHGKGKQINAF